MRRALLAVVLLAAAAAADTTPPRDSRAAVTIVTDAQTSGGLLLSVPKDHLPHMLSRADKLSLDLWEIGEVVEGHGITVLPA